MDVRLWATAASADLFPSSLVARCPSLVARTTVNRLTLPTYLLTYLVTYILTYPNQIGFSTFLGLHKKREAVNRRPSIVNRQPLTVPWRKEKPSTANRPLIWKSHYAYLLTYLFIYFIYFIYFTSLTRTKTRFWYQIGPLEKRETVNRQPSTVNRQPSTVNRALEKREAVNR